MRRLVPGLIMLAGAVAWAGDAPHDLSAAPGITCDSCHTLHMGVGLGVALTSVAGNANLCKSCHDSRGATFAWATTDQAQPGTSGNSHRWDAVAVDATHGARAPVNLTMSQHLTGGKLQCSTCHDPHGNVGGLTGSQRTSVAVGTSLTRLAGTGTGTFVLNQPAAAANARGYRVEVIVAGALGTSTFRVSNDNGVSWFGWSGAAWGPGIATGRPTGASVALNDGASVTVTFAGSFLVGDRWDFYVAYPMLQMTNTNSAMCEDCHQPRVQSAVYVESGGDGTKVFSHPVGETLAKSYDRAAANILDADGTVQTTGDGLRTNNLVLDSTSRVRCQSCHSIHNSDSNSLTEDP